jgi:hypothetical protein
MVPLFTGGSMKNQRTLVAVTVLNGLLFLISVTRTGAVVTPGVEPVLRGRGLEIVDQRGRVRASISILPADSTVKMPDGTTGYPETVLLRLITSEGRPNVKIGTGERGAGMLIAGAGDPTYVQILAEGPRTSMKLSDKDGRVRVFKP